MKLRNLLTGLGALAGAGGIIGTGAFTSVAADRDLTVAVADDSDALLRMAPCSGSPNSGYATETSDGLLALNLSSDSQTANGGQGVNPEATTVIRDVFEICNQGTQTVGVWLEIDPIENGNGNDAVTLTRDGELIVGEDNAVCLDPGDCVCVGIEARTQGIADDVNNLFQPVSDGSEVVVHADADAECTLPGIGPAPSDLVAYWPFDGDPNDIVGGRQPNDETGIEYVDGKVGQAARFEEGDYIQVPDDSGLEVIGGSFTISLWVQTDSTDRGGFIRKNMTDSWQPVYSVEYDYANGGLTNDKQVRFLLSDTEGETPEIISNTQVNGDGVDGDGWYHILAMYDDSAGEMSLYINGTQEATKSITFNQTDTTGDLQFGRMRNDDRGIVGELDGTIDDVRIYDRTLSSAEIAALSSQ
jgi:hypothetical protein